MVRGRNEEKQSGASSFPLGQRDLLHSVDFTPMEMEDLPRIMEIEHFCFSSPWSEDSFREIIQGPTFQTLTVRTQQNQILGYVVFSHVLDELHVLNVAVHPSFRKQGLAETLLRKIHQQALEKGCAFSYLEVRQSNVSAQRLYDKLGYVMLGKRKQYYLDDGEDAIVMVAPLKERNSSGLWTQNPK